MSERAPERQPSTPERSASTRLERQSTAERRSEGRAEQPHEQLKSVEAAREKLKVAAEQSKPEQTKEPIAKRRPKLVTPAERQAAYRTTMQQVRQQLPPLQRNFSRLIHARPVEVAAELLEETVYRPSFLLVGGLGALLVGTGFYVVARTQEWALSGSEFTLSLLIGGVIGLALEWIWRHLKRD